MQTLQMKYHVEVTNPGASLNEFEQQKLLENLRLVRSTVSRIMHRLPRHIDAEDLIHTGILGLMDAVKKFSWDPQKNHDEFRAYAECRIRGQVLDELRKMDLLPRSMREKINRFKRAYDALSQKFNRDPTDEEICKVLDISMETCQRLKSELHMGKEVSYSPLEASQALEKLLASTVEGKNQRNPEVAMQVREIHEILSEEIQSLDEKERNVVSLYYLEDLTLKEIGNLYSLTEARVSQIHAAAMEKLYKKMRSRLGMKHLPLE